jgi:hypothetical protein
MSKYKVYNEEENLVLETDAVEEAVGKACEMITKSSTADTISGSEGIREDTKETGMYFEVIDPVTKDDIFVCFVAGLTEDEWQRYIKPAQRH